MNDVEPRHPEAMTMAAFVEGTLAPNEIAAVADHLRGCNDCRTVVSETARFEREEEREAPSHATRWWLLAAAAVLAAIAITIPLLRWTATRNASPIAGLIQAAPRQHRFIEARISGFPWAQLQAPPRGEAIPDPGDLKLTGAAGEVLEKTAGQRQAELRHATGLAYLLINRKNDSITALEQATNGSSDAHAWSDLAAARYAVATQDEHPSQLPLALADADHALRLDPKSPEALFNRALILEHLGIRDQARKAWLAYLAIDSGSAWSVEARAHLRELEKTSRRFDPKMLETMPADQLVREFPQEARTWGEGPMLAAWADAEAAKDPSAAAKLTRVHAIADALAAFNGERLLADAVGAIERSSGSARAALLAGHHVYAEARFALSKRNAGAAGPKLARAAVLFREGNSPMTYMAEYNAAIADFDENQGDNANRALSRLASLIDSGRYRALAAQIKGSEAVAANGAGYWGTGVRAAAAGAEIFRSLGESRNAAYLDSAGAHALDMIGAGDLAWSSRTRSLAVFTGPEDRTRLCSVLRSSATTLASFGQITAAISIIDLAVDELGSDPALLAATLTDRASLSDRSGDTTAAGRFIVRAHQAAATVREPRLLEMLNASIDVAQAALNSRTQPQEAIGTLNRAIAFFAGANLRDLMPNAYLQRARSFHAAGDDAAALADYRAALREIEAQQNTINGNDLRLRFLDTAAQIIDESVEISLSRGRVSEALAIADRPRELRRISPSALSNALTPAPRGTAVIEYAVLPYEIDIFCIVGGQVTVNKVTAERQEIGSRIAAFTDGIRRRAPIEQIKPEAIALFNLLIAPVQAHLSGAADIVIVPDRQLHALPFAALYDDATGQYLAERLPIRFASSASAIHDETANQDLQPVLVVADPVTPGRPRLPISQQEGQMIATAYGVTALSGVAATPRRFIELASRSSLIHYAGHADSDAADAYGALILAGDRDAGVLDSKDIEALSLVRHPLVVLAACGTFRGDAIHIGGMSSLARSFLLAGARGVVGTLWDIDDDVAATVFLKFHDHLRAGESPERSVRAAQIEMIHASDLRLRHPATWTPVELLGNF